MTSKQSINAEIKFKLYKLPQIKPGAGLTWTCSKVKVFDLTELNWLLGKMKVEDDHRLSQPAPT